MSQKGYITAPTEGQLTDAVIIDTSAIPVEVRDRLAEATLEMVRGILRQPGGRSALEARIAAKRMARAAKGSKE